MVGVLKEILCRDPVSGRPCVARELQVLVEHLIGVAPNPQFLPSAIEALAFIVAAAHSMRFARSPTASAAVVIILFHLNVTSSSTMVERFLANRAACHRPSAFLYVNRHAAVPLGARRSQCAEALFRADFAMRWPAFPRARPMSAPTAALTLKGSGRLSNSFFDASTPRFWGSPKTLIPLRFSKQYAAFHRPQIGCGGTMVEPRRTTKGDHRITLPQADFERRQPA
jgi:hypothetical protein